MATNKHFIPSLTIGRTVADLDYLVMAEYLGFDGDDWEAKIEEFVKKEMQPYSPQATIKNSSHSSAILAKGFGGRIGQNQPTEVFVPRKFKQDLNKRRDVGIELKAHPNAKSKVREINGKYDSTIIVDIDISGCYAESQRVQVLPIGRPIVGGLKLDTVSENNYPSLKEFLLSCKVKLDVLLNQKWNNYEEYQQNIDVWGELEYGAFNFFIDVKNLKEVCDILPSWVHPSKSIDHKVLCKLLADAVKGDDKAIEKIKQGSTKKLLNETEISPINLDILEWIFFVASPNLRKELLEKARVIAFVVYPKSYRLFSTEEKIKGRIQDCQRQLEQKREEWKITNSINLDFGDKFALYSEEYRDCHYWYGETIGDIILNKMLANRKVAQWIKKKSPLDLLYKLFCNTHYGVSISPLFAISNICVGNNITARCRVLAWLMEKSLIGYPTVTDGCFFQVNRVLKTYERLTINNSCVNMDSPNSPIGKRNYGIQALPYGFKFEDKNFKYEATVIEYVMKDKRIYAICDVIQTSKVDGLSNQFESVSPLDRIIKWENGKAIKENMLDKIAIQAKSHIQECFPLLNVVWMNNTSIKVKAKKEEYNKLSSEEKTPDMVNVVTIARQGLADFEIKDYYHSSAIQGMANYLLQNEVAVIKGRDLENKNQDDTDVKEFILNHKSQIGCRNIELKNSDDENWVIEIEYKNTIAFRGYESSKTHVAITKCDGQLVKSDRYQKSDNPAKDFMVCLTKNDNAVPRQYTAVKTRNISIGDYANNPKKFDEVGFSAGDVMKVCILFTEFTPTQFNQKTKEQYFGWADEVSKSKKKYGQSIEAWFTNQDGTLRFKDMCLWVADAMERGVIDPIKELSSYGKRNKSIVGKPNIKISEQARYHPEWETFQHIKKSLAIGELIEDKQLEEPENDDAFTNDYEEVGVGV